MKKINKISLSLLIAVSLVGCGSNQKSDKDNSKEIISDLNKDTKILKDTDIARDDADNTNLEKDRKLPSFEGVDQDDKQFTNEDFKNYDATVINFWFTGCSACIEEMPALNKLSDDIKKESNVNFISVCTDKNYDDSTKEAYDRIIKENKVKYQAIAIRPEGEIKTYLDSIFAFPTTIVVDKKGNIVGEDVIGALTSKEQIDKLMKNIDLGKKASDK